MPATAGPGPDSVGPVEEAASPAPRAPKTAPSAPWPAKKIRCAVLPRSLRLISKTQHIQTVRHFFLITAERRF
jgi:hypothetical protein